MRIEFDAAKNEKNIRERGLPFTLAAEFDWTSAMVVPSDRKGESRLLAIGFLGDRLHTLVFTKIDDGFRVISLRRAGRREVRLYEKAQS